MKEGIKEGIKEWIKRRTFGDWAFAALAIAALVLRGPIFIEHFQKEGSIITPVAIKGRIFPPPKEKAVLVFWATWCGPCSIELKRLNSAVTNGEISSKYLYAVNMGEESSVVLKTAAERKYVFPIVQDPKGELARELGVSVTPTIALVSADGRIINCPTRVGLKNCMT